MSDNLKAGTSSMAHPRMTPLDGAVVKGHYGPPFQGQSHLRLSLLRDLEIVEVAAFRGEGKAVADAAGKAVGTAPSLEPLSVSGEAPVALWIGPERWLIMDREGKNLEAALRAAVPADKGAVVAQGHGRAVFRLEGDQVRSVLAKGCTLDLHPDAFLPGECRTTALFAMTATLRCVSESCFEILVFRSFARSFHEALVDACLEFGVEVFE